MSDYFQRDYLDDNLEDILQRQPLKELPQMQLVNRHWRRIIRRILSSRGLGKDSLLLVCNTDTFLGVLHTEKLLESRPIFTPRMFRDIKLPVVNIIGSCGGLICLVDSTETLFVLNPRNLECRNLMMIGNGIPSGAYGFGSLTRGHVLIKMADRPFSHVLRMSLFDLKLNEWRPLRIDFREYDWSFQLVSRAHGVFINGFFCWLGRVTQGNQAFDSIIMYNGNENRFDYIKLLECMIGLKLQLGTLGEGRAGMWEIGRCTCIWLMHPHTKQFDEIPIRGYGSASVCPLYICQEREFAVMLVQNQRVSLYNLKSHHIVKDIKHFPAHTLSHCMFQAISFKDTYVSPSQ